MLRNSTYFRGLTAPKSYTGKRFTEARQEPYDFQKKGKDPIHLAKAEIKGRALRSAFNDLILSRKAMHCSDTTIMFYQNTARRFILWAEANKRVTKPKQINGNLVRCYLAGLVNRSMSDWTVNDHARAIRTLLRFWYLDKIILYPVSFQMPRVRKNVSSYF